MGKKTPEEIKAEERRGMTGKTLADTIAEERKELTDWSWTDEITAPDENGDPNDYARRVVSLDVALDALSNIEAAAKRQRAVLDANIARVRKLEDMLGGAADAVLGAAIKQKAAGDAAAMREALENVVEYLGGVIRTRRENGLVESARAALAKPARNCDILSEEEANEAWDEYRHSHVLPRGGWDFRHVIAWLFAKAEGGKG